MATRSRIAPNIDAGRLRQAIAGPGADPRTWGFEGRIDDDPDAIRWDSKLGWLCDVTVTGGQLDGEGPITCRVQVPFAAANLGGPFHPPRRDLNVVVMLPMADLNSTPIITGYVFDDNAPVPTSFGDLEANEDNLQNTHAMKSDKDVDMQFAGKMTVDFDGNGKATFGDELQLDAQNIKLAGATQAFVRGDDLKQTLDQLVQAIATAFTSITPQGGGPAIGTTFAQAVLAYNQAMPGTLSTRIKGE